MPYNTLNISRFLLLFLFTLLPFSILADEKRAMTVEDVMNFHNLHAAAISHNGQWIAYHAWPGRGDGYGVLVSADAKKEYVFERAQNARFSARGNWLLFTRVPTFKATEGVKPDERPRDSLLLIRTGDASTEDFAELRRASFSQTKEFLFVHQHHAKDTTLTKAQSEKIKKAGSPLIIRNLENGQQTMLPFVDTWSVDSLATTLVFTLKDTLASNNGLYFLSLNTRGATPQPLDTIGRMKFNRFTWHEETSHLAYVKARDVEKDTMETAIIYTWKPGMAAPAELITQQNAPGGSFIPYDNRLSWSYDGGRLYFGFRPNGFAAKGNNAPAYASTVDSIRSKADIDVWHVADPLIKTQEKVLWNQVRTQNLMAVYHLQQQNIVKLASEEIPDIQLARSGNKAIASTSIPYATKMTWDGRFRDVYVMDQMTGEKQLVLQDFGDMSLISPNGRYLLYFENKDWHAYDIPEAKHRNLTSSLDVFFYDESHDRPSEPSGYRIAGWMEDEQTPLIYDRYDVWQADLATGSMRNITGGEGRKTKTVLRINRLNVDLHFSNKQEIFLEGFDENTKETAIYTARLDRQGVSKLMDAGQNIKLHSMSEDGKTLVFTSESFDVFPDLWVTNTGFRKPVQVSNLNRQLAPFNWGTAQLISFQTNDGISLQAVAILPGDYDPKVQYPVFVYYYEKSSQRLHDFNETVVNHRPGFGFYSSNGYVMLLPDIHFIEGRPGMSAVRSLVPAAQKLIDMGIANPNAIGLHGHSWSGYQTAYVVTQTNMFKAAIAGAPVSNMTSAYGGIRWGTGMARQFMYEKGQSRIGASLFEQRHLYIENSPIFYANEINTPLLLMHGDKDEAVPWEQSIEMYLAMRRAGKDVIFLQYRDEPHHPQKYPNKMDYTIRMKEYFDYHLKGIDPPEWIIKGSGYIGK